MQYCPQAVLPRQLLEPPHRQAVIFSSWQSFRLLACAELSTRQTILKDLPRKQKASGCWKLEPRLSQQSVMVELRCYKAQCNHFISEGLMFVTHNSQVKFTLEQNYFYCFTLFCSHTLLKNLRYTDIIRFGSQLLLHQIYLNLHTICLWMFSWNICTHDLMYTYDLDHIQTLWTI